MVSAWVFDRVAEGLMLGMQPPSRCLSKVYPQNVLLDSSGSPILTKEGAATETTWRSHHAFSGRCGLSADTIFQQPQEISPSSSSSSSRGGRGGGDSPQPDVCSSQDKVEVSSDPMDYRAWVADFHLRSRSADPHVLLSIAPHYAPPNGNLSLRRTNNTWRTPTKEEQNTYDKRILETPLIWEEPMAFSFDCTSNGLYLWSEEWGFWGDKIFDKCFEYRSKPSTLHDINNLYSTDSSSNDFGLSPPNHSLEGMHEISVRLKWQWAGHHDTSSGEQSSPDPVASPMNELCNGGWVSVYLQSHQVSGVNGLGSSSAFADPTASLVNGGNDIKGDARLGSEARVWQRVWGRCISMDNVPDKIVFKPYVTLLDAGDEVTLV